MELNAFLKLSGFSLSVLTLLTQQQEEIYLACETCSKIPAYK